MERTGSELPKERRSRHNILMIPGSRASNAHIPISVRVHSSSPFLEPLAMPISVLTQAPHTTSPLARDIPMHARESAPRSSGGHPLTSSSSITYVNGSSGIRASSEPVAGAGGGRSSEVMSGAESSVGAGGEKPKKGKKKGWKGWALVVEDEEGNVIEVRDRGESPSGHRELSPEFSRGE